MGRPFEGNTELIALRVEPGMLAEIEEAGEEDGVNRSELMRQLLRAGLAARARRRELLKNSRG